MSMQYCDNCDTHIDTDYNAEHFLEGDCNPCDKDCISNTTFHIGNERVKGKCDCHTCEFDIPVIEGDREIGKVCECGNKPEINEE